MGNDSQGGENSPESPLAILRHRRFFPGSFCLSKPFLRQEHAEIFVPWQSPEAPPNPFFYQKKKIDPVPLVTKGHVGMSGINAGSWGCSWKEAGSSSGLGRAGSAAPGFEFRCLDSAGRGPEPRSPPSPPSSHRRDVPGAGKGSEVPQGQDGQGGAESVPAGALGGPTGSLCPWNVDFPALGTWSGAAGDVCAGMEVGTFPGLWGDLGDIRAVSPRAAGLCSQLGTGGVRIPLPGAPTPP